MKKDIFKDIGDGWKDYLETDKNIDKTKFKTGEKYALLECYKEWKEKEYGKNYPNSYELAEELLKKYKIPFLSEDEINEFVEAKGEEYEYNGIFVSTVINNLYRDDDIHLSFGNFNYLDIYNKNKKIIVEGDCGDILGHGMKGGIIKVCGDNFNPKEQIATIGEKGEIYHKDKLVWKDGEFI